MRFKAGDRVRVRGGEYGYTGVGSEGIVVTNNGETITVSFDTLMNGYWQDIIITPVIFTIQAYYLEVIGKSSPYSHVIRKIKQMQQRREALGYKF